MHVADWLRSLGLEQYEPAFRENEIDDKMLPRLTAEDLKELGVTVVGHRRRLLDAIIAHVIGDKAVEAGDRIGDAAMIGADDLAQVFGVQARRERRRADQIAEQHAELAAFGAFGSPAEVVAPCRFTAECRSRLSV